MHGDVINSDTPIKLKVTVLANKTVEGLLAQYNDRVGDKFDGQTKEEFRELIRIVISKVNDLKVSDVESGNLMEIKESIVSLGVMLNEDEKSDLYNTLDICVVGLGSALRKEING